MRQPNRQPLQVAENNWQDEDGRVDVSTLSTSQRAIDFIAHFETYSLNAYNDSENYCTIGVGHLIEKRSCEVIKASERFRNLHDEDIYANGITKSEILNGITNDKQREMFASNLATAERYVRSHVTVRLHQQEFDSLVSLVYNTGGLAAAPNLSRHLNNAEYSQVSHEFLDIINRGKPSEGGLRIRRNAEANMFDNNIYDSRH